MVFLLFALWFIQETCNTLLTSTIIKIKSNICGFKITLSYSSFVKLICFFILLSQRHLHLDWLLGLLYLWFYNNPRVLLINITPTICLVLVTVQLLKQLALSLHVLPLILWKLYFWYHHADLSNLADFDDKLIGFATCLGNSRRKGALLDIDWFSFFFFCKWIFSLQIPKGLLEEIEAAEECFKKGSVSCF